MKNQKQVFAVIRIDEFMTGTAVADNGITIKEIVPTQQTAESEVERLNQLNKDKGCRYFWQATRMVECGSGRTEGK